MCVGVRSAVRRTVSVCSVVALFRGVLWCALLRGVRDALRCTLVWVCPGVHPVNEYGLWCALCGCSLWCALRRDLLMFAVSEFKICKPKQSYREKL